MSTAGKFAISVILSAAVFGSSTALATNSCSSLFLPESTRSQADSAKAHVWKLLKNESNTSAQIQDALSADPRLKALLDADAGVWEGYTIRQHNERVYEVFDKILPQFKAHPLFKESSPIRGMALLKATIALHDIGKPIAVQHGNKDDQHTYTLPILSQELSRLGFTDKEVRIAKALADNDVFGDMLKGRISLDEALVSLQKLSQSAGIDFQSYVSLQALFYTIDAASYPKLNSMLFGHDRAGNLIPTNQLYENLMARVSTRKAQNLLSPLRDLVPDSLSAAWAPNHFTDPRQHNPDNYKYLVHGSWGPELFTSFMRRGFLDSFSQISVSAIDSHHTNTFSPVGLILDVPKENIFAAHPTDMLSGSIQKNGKDIRAADYVDSISALYEAYGLRSPEETLAKTQARPAKNAFGHNEVIASSLGLNGKSIKVKGAFYSVDSLGKPLAKPELLKTVRELAAKHKYPMVPIAPSKGFFTVQVEIKQDHVQVKASKEDFQRLQTAAKAANVNLVGVESGAVLTAGAFNGDRFFKFQEANTSPEKLASLHPSMVFEIRYETP